MNWDRVRILCPEACQVFSAWTVMKSPLRGWGKRLRGGVVIAELPMELVHGILLSFFKEQDILFDSDIDLLGALRVRGFKTGTYGTYVVFHTGRRWIHPMKSWGRAYLAAFKELERRITGVLDMDDSDEMIVGIDMGDLTFSNVVADGPEEALGEPRPPAPGG